MHCDPNYQRTRAEARVKSQAAQAIYDARTAAGLTQSQIVHLAGTTQSVISRLEDSDYDRHSLATLERIAVRWIAGSKSASFPPSPRSHARPEQITDVARRKAQD